MEKRTEVKRVNRTIEQYKCRKVEEAKLVLEKVEKYERTNVEMQICRKSSQGKQGNQGNLTNQEKQNQLRQYIILY